MAGKLLDEVDSIELVKALLGHSPANGATDSYAASKARKAAQRLDEITAEARQRGLRLFARESARHKRRTAEVS